MSPQLVPSRAERHHQNVPYTERACAGIPPAPHSMGAAWPDGQRAHACATRLTATSCIAFSRTASRADTCGFHTAMLHIAPPSGHEKRASTGCGLTDHDHGRCKRDALLLRPSNIGNEGPTRAEERDDKAALMNAESSTNNGKPGALHSMWRDS